MESFVCLKFVLFHLLYIRHCLLLLLTVFLIFRLSAVFRCDSHTVIESLCVTYASVSVGSGSGSELKVHTFNRSDIGVIVSVAVHKPCCLSGRSTGGHVVHRAAQPACLLGLQVVAIGDSGAADRADFPTLFMSGKDCESFPCSRLRSCSGVRGNDQFKGARSPQPRFCATVA